MKILIPTIGSRGDVQPFIALAQELERAGHAIMLASHPVIRDLVDTYAVTFKPIGPDFDLAREVWAIRARSNNSLLGVMRAMRFSFDMLERSHQDILALCQGADLLAGDDALRQAASALG